MKIEFDKNIPIPPQPQRSKYHFDKMEVGESKFWPGKAAGKAVVAFARGSEKKFTTRRVTEKDETGAMVDGLRVWRTE